MKKYVTYSTKCKLCNSNQVYVLRDIRNRKAPVNDLSNNDVMEVIHRYDKDPLRLQFCEECKLVTRQEIVAFDY